MYVFAARIYTLWMLVLILIALFPIFFYLAQDRAFLEAHNIRMGYAKPIVLEFKERRARYFPKEFRDANARGDLVLIAQTKERYFVLYQPKHDEQEIPYGYAYDIAREDVSLAKIELQNISIRGGRDD
jgi:hypothetical protein